MYISRQGTGALLDVTGSADSAGETACGSLMRGQGAWRAARYQYPMVSTVISIPGRFVRDNAVWAPAVMLGSPS
jgi:hypothetical protein